MAVMPSEMRMVSVFLVRAAMAWRSVTVQAEVSEWTRTTASKFLVLRASATWSDGGGGAVLGLEDGGVPLVAFADFDSSAFGELCRC